MPTYEPFDWYETPLYYDMVFDEGTAQEADFLEAVAAKHARPGGDGAPLAVLEPACGSGRVMAELAQRGHRVAGVDLSEGMLAYARKRFKTRGVPPGSAKLLHGPMQDFDLHGHTGSGGYDLAHVLVSSFKYLPAEDDAAGCLRCVCDHLRPGGVFVLGLHLAEYGHDEAVTERWRVKRDGVTVSCNIKTWPADRKTRTEKMRSRITARYDDGSPARRYETCWRFRTYSPSQLRSLIRKEPRFKHVATYTFHHDIGRPTALDSDDLGVVLVLRREG